MPAVIAIPARKRLAWHAWLDMPVGLKPSQTTGGPTGHILLGEISLCYDGPYAPDVRGGWLVMLAVTNTGWTPVRGSDFAAPLTFAFPGRQILSAQISPDPAVRAATQRANPPTICLSTENSRQLRAGNRNQARIQVAGDFLLRPGHSYAITVILSGTPAPDSPRILQDGSLTGGKIIIGAGDSSAHPALA